MDAKERLAALYRDERMRLGRGELGREGDTLHPVFGEGPLKPSLMLIGEAPGKEEAASGRPFVGKAGKQLDDMLVKAKLKRQDIYVTNAVKFRPVRVSPKSVANRTPSRAEILDGLELLRLEIELIAPGVIATLGNTPLFAIGAVAGKRLGTVGEVHGAPVRITVGAAEITLFPLYHPASGIYNRSLIEVMEQDLVALGAYIAGKER